MKITGVSINRPLNKAQGAIKKVSSVAKPLTLAVDEVSGRTMPDTDTDTWENPKNNSKNKLDTLGSEVDVWA